MFLNICMYMFLILYEPSKKKPFYELVNKKKLYFFINVKSRCVTIEPINVNHGFIFFGNRETPLSFFFFLNLFGYRIDLC